ncbi:MAG: hypothetical protein K6B28_12275 [Lachnospiraceae bacterium]|nr:hypothetical protein [Lachnospiraceae bacterium]
MKELLNDLIVIYDDCKSFFKPLVLFLVSVLAISLMNDSENKDDNGSRVSPAVFVLSFFTGIAYAFSLAIKNYKKDEKRLSGILVRVVACFLFIEAIILSGERVIGNDHFYRTENALHISTEKIALMDFILKDSEGSSVVRIAAPEEIAVCLRPYSSRFDPVFEQVDIDHLDKLTKEGQIIYEEFMYNDPDMKTVADAAMEAGCTYIVTDNEKYYPEFKLSEFGYELVSCIGSLEVYKLKGGDV